MYNSLTYPGRKNFSTYSIWGRNPFLHWLPTVNLPFYPTSRNSIIRQLRQLKQKLKEGRDASVLVHQHLKDLLKMHSSNSCHNYSYWDQLSETHHLESIMPTCSDKELSEERREDLLGQRPWNSTLSCLTRGTILAETLYNILAESLWQDEILIREGCWAAFPGLCSQWLQRKHSVTEFLFCHLHNGYNMLHNSCSIETETVCECTISRMKSHSWFWGVINMAESKVQSWMPWDP